MSDERYAPPSANLANAPADVPGNGTFDLGVAFSEAWAATWANFWLLLGVGIVGLLLTIASAFTVVGLFLLVPVLGWGGIRFMLNVLDGTAQFSDLFSGFQDYGRVLLSMLVLYVLSFLISLLGQSLSLIGNASSVTTLQLLGTPVSVAWSLLVMSRLNLAWFYAVDQGMGPVESLQAAWDATVQLKMNCALLLIMTGVVFLLGLLAFIIGIIPASMIASLLLASAYRQLAGRRSVAS